MTTYIWVSFRIVDGVEERFASWDEAEVREWAGGDGNYWFAAFPMSGKLRVV